MEYLRHRQLGKKLWTAYDLWRTIYLRIWNTRNDSTVLRQIHGVVESTEKDLRRMQIRSIQQLAVANPGYMSEIMCKSIKFCTSLVTQAQSIVIFKIQSIIQHDRKNLQIKIGSECVGPMDPRNTKQTCCLIVFCGKKLLSFDDMIKAPTTLLAPMPCELMMNEWVQIRLMHEQYVGLDDYINLPLETGGYVEYGSPFLEGMRQQRSLERDKLKKEKLSHLKETKKFTKYVNVLTAHHTNAKQQTIRHFMKPTKMISPDQQHGIVTPRKRHRNYSDKISRECTLRDSQERYRSPESSKAVDPFAFVKYDRSKPKPVRAVCASRRGRQEKPSSSTKKMCQLHLNVAVPTEMLQKEKSMASSIAEPQLACSPLKFDPGYLDHSSTSQSQQYKSQTMSSFAI